MLLSHNDLKNYYELIFAMVQHHHYSITDIENSYPYEFDIYVNLLRTYIEKEKEKQKAESLRQGIK